MRAPNRPRFDGREFDRVQAWALANVEALAAEYAGVELRRGRCRCPLHDSDNPDAFSVANGKGWHCFTGDCGSGDGVELVRRLRFPALAEREGRIAALRELSPRAGVWLEETPAGKGAPVPRSKSPEKSPASPRRKSPEKSPEPPDPCAALRLAGIVPATRREVQRAACVEGMTLGPKGRAYLAARGFHPDNAAGYGFRSLEDARAWRTLTAHLAESYMLEELTAAGVPATLPLTGPCLVIPYHTRDGAVWSWRLRSLEGKEYRTLAGDVLPEPFNAPDLEDLSAADTLHVVEGELNAYALTLTGARVIGLAGAGTWRPAWTDAVSAAGKLVLWYDNDPAGEKGYTRLVEALLPVLGRSGVRERVRRVRINAPDAKDANDLHRLGRLRPLMESAPWMT
jgi:hypothetical protein